MKRHVRHTLKQEASALVLRLEKPLAGKRAGLAGAIDKHAFVIARILFIVFLFFFSQRLVFAQNCASSGTHNQSSSENTYYAPTMATLNPGSTSITLNAVAAGYGVTPIAIGDQVLIIQMQGAQINSVNGSTYGSATIGPGSGFTTTNLVAGKMEFATATSAVPLVGGVLTISAGTLNTYINAAYGANGQYTYQVIRVPSYFNIQLTATVTTPIWNGAVGGVTVISAVSQLNFNGQTINASGAGFRGGAGRQLHGGAGTIKTDYMTLATTNANGSKGEGLAGTPRYINNNGVLLDNVSEGYPGGSYARGAPGNAGGGGTDSDPTANDQNSGGGGGGNGNGGGQGGNGWFSAGTTGGKAGAQFSTPAPYTTYYSPARMILGGGGGAGTTNDGTGVPGAGFASSGASGGGLVITIASSFIGNGTVNVSGQTANNTAIIDGSGGGGAGGSALLYAASGLSNITVNAAGGAGGSNDPGSVSATQHGPGGGGGGGVVFSNANLNAATSVSGGIAGTSVSILVTSNFGAVAGGNGVLTQNITNAQLPPNTLTCQGTITLPVTLVNFSASLEAGNAVQLSWITTDDGSTSYFGVQRSTDGIYFSLIGDVQANHAAGNEHNYTYTDNIGSLHAAVVYYRLQMVDADGKMAYSKIELVHPDASANTQVSVYPNPATDYAVLKMNTDKQAAATVRLMDNSGRQIMVRSFTLNPGNNNLTIDQLTALPRGIYFIQVAYNSSIITQKLVKQ
jgi:hypothetical protein